MRAHPHTLRRRVAPALALATAMLAAGMLTAPAAQALTPGAVLPLGFLGLPSLHGIIEAIAGGFFTALAKALVPSWLMHGTVATIQHLVALPDPAEWGHVSALQGEMTYLGAMFAPVTLSVAALRYWTVGLTGAAHPASALARCAGATGVLVAYRWIVEQVIAGTNTLTHGLLALPSVSAGLARIIGVLFGGALLSGGGGVFGALLVIVGVILAAGLFAAQVLLTVVLAVLIVGGPPLIALAAIPELAHLARAWRDALMVVALIPLGWTVLFATAGALCLDATSFTGGAAGLPGHVAAAFAGLITFALAVKLPLVLIGELRHVLSRGHAGAGGSTAASGALPGSERVRSAHARLRAVGLVGAPSLGASVGAAAGALGAPAGGPLGAARRRLSHAVQRGERGTAGSPRREPGAAAGRGQRIGERTLAARAILARAPGEASRAVRQSMRPAPSPGGRGSSAGAAARTRKDPARGPRRAGARDGSARPQPAGGAPAPASASTSRPRSRVTLAAVPAPPARPAGTSEPKPAAPSPPRPPLMHSVGEHDQRPERAARPLGDASVRSRPPAPERAREDRATPGPREAPAPPARPAKPARKQAQSPRGGKPRRGRRA